MRNAGMHVVIVGLLMCSCGGSSPSTIGSHNSGGSSSSGGGGGSGSGGSGEDGSLSTDEGGGTSSSDAGGLTLDGADWECQESVVLGGYSATCVSCVEAMCTSQLVVCETSSCMTCEEPVFTCEGQMCSSACGGTSSSSGATGEGGAAAAGTCAGLMMCCGLVAAVDPTYGTTCTMIAAGGNEASCQTVIAMFPPGITSYCN